MNIIYTLDDYLGHFTIHCRIILRTSISSLIIIWQRYSNYYLLIKIRFFKSFISKLIDSNSIRINPLTAQFIKLDSVIFLCLQKNPTFKSILFISSMRDHIEIFLNSINALLLVQAFQLALLFLTIICNDYRKI